MVMAKSLVILPLSTVSIQTCSKVLQKLIYLFLGIGTTYLDEGDLAQAEEAFEQARQSASQLGQGDALAGIYCSLGDLSSRKRDWAKAENDYKQCQQAAFAAKQQYDGIQSEASLARLNELRASLAGRRIDVDTP